MIETSGRPPRASWRSSTPRSTSPAAVAGMSSIARAAKRPPQRTEGCSIAETRSRSRPPCRCRPRSPGRAASEIGFGPARGEDHVPRVGPDQHGDVAPGFFHQAACRAPLCMDRGGIADHIAGANHGGAGLQAQRGRGIPVEVGATAGHPCPIRSHACRNTCFLPPGLCYKAPARPASHQAWLSAAGLHKFRMVLNSYVRRLLPSSALSRGRPRQCIAATAESFEETHA